MAFYLSKERDDDPRGSYLRYQAYLRENKERFPPGAFALATALWWQLPHDHRCPHDARLVHATLAEDFAHREHSTPTLHIRLRGAYNDGFLDLRYPRVLSYRLESSHCERGHGDWRYDEFTLSPRGNLVHEIEWTGFPDDEGSRWIIEASDVQFTWLPDHIPGDGTALSGTR